MACCITGTQYGIAVHEGFVAAAQSSTLQGKLASCACEEVTGRSAIIAEIPTTFAILPSRKKFHLDIRDERLRSRRSFA